MNDPFAAAGTSAAAEVSTVAVCGSSPGLVTHEVAGIGKPELGGDRGETVGV